MTNFLKNIPQGVLSDYSIWRPIILESCPLMAAALRFGEARNIDTVFLPRNDPALNRHIAVAHAADNRLLIAQSPEFNDFHYLQALAHEIKHFAQGDANALYSVLLSFVFDAERSLESGEYQMQRRYRLPTAANIVLMNVVYELDANIYALAAFIECKHKIIENRVVDKELYQLDAINKLFEGMIKDEETLQPWIDYGAIRATGIAGAMNMLIQKFGLCPSIDWIPVSTESLQQMVKTLWKESGFRFPLAEKRGADVIGTFRDRFLNHKDCVATMNFIAQAPRMAASLNGQRPG